MLMRCLGAVFLLWLAGCGELNSPHPNFNVPSQMTLYSIREDHVPHSERAVEAMDIEVLPLLGKTEITDPQIRQEIIDNLNQHAKKLDLDSCFNPRHGIRAVEGTKRTDYIICFECATMYVIADGKRIDYSINYAAQATLNKILVAAGVPLNKLRR